MQQQTLTGEYRDEMRNEYSLFLAPFDFNWFCTFTFAEERHPESARKAFSCWLNILNTELHGRRWRNRSPEGVVWVNALEYQKRGVVHYHSLVAGIPHDRSLELARYYQDVWRVQLECGFARIDLIDDKQQAVKNYVCKYVGKGGELEFSRNFATRDHELQIDTDLVG